MRLLNPHLGERIRGFPHRVRESYPLSRVPRSRDWELLVISYLVLVTIVLFIFLIFSYHTLTGCNSRPSR